MTSNEAAVAGTVEVGKLVVGVGDPGIPPPSRSGCGRRPGRPDGDESGVVRELIVAARTLPPVGDAESADARLRGVMPPPRGRRGPGRVVWPSGWAAGGVGGMTCRCRTTVDRSG